MWQQPRGSILNRTALSVSLPLPFLLPHLLLSVSPSLTAFFPGWGVHGPSGSAAFVSNLECSENFVNSLRWSGKGEKGKSSWWDTARQQKQTPLETASGLSIGGNPPENDERTPQAPNPLGPAGTPRGFGRPQPRLCQWGWGLLHAGAADKRTIQPGPGVGEADSLHTWWWGRPKTAPCQEDSQGKDRQQQEDR